MIQTPKSARKSKSTDPKGMVTNLTDSSRALRSLCIWSKVIITKFTHWSNYAVSYGIQQAKTSYDTCYYHIFNSCKCIESMGKPCSFMQFMKRYIFYYKSCEGLYQYCKSCENPYQYYKLMRESVSGAASHMCCVWLCNEVCMIKSLSP